MSKTNFNKTNLNPNNLSEVIGFDFLFPQNTVIRKMLDTKKIFSTLFFGSPGSGKSMIVQLLLKELNLEYHLFNSTIHNKNDLNDILKKASKENKINLVIEEIHRLNKDKQDILLSYLELNFINLFATTTENPFFVVNPAIRSRMYLYEMKKINDIDLINELNKYLRNKEINIDSDIVETIVYKSNCDFRQIFMYIDMYLSMYNDVSKNEILENLFGYYNSNLDINGTNFYDNLSAYHKSVRGSDVDASIYYLSILLQANNLLPIFRRMYAIAHEDIGLANPQIGTHVHSAIEAAKALGMPEARIPLANATIEMALSPKSNTSIDAIDKAIEVSNKYNYLPPIHIRDNHYSSATKLGVTGYKYPHNYLNNWVEQQYLPNELKNNRFYKYNKQSVYENKLNTYWTKIKNKNGE